jgi:hypothetical protein
MGNTRRDPIPHDPIPHHAAVSTDANDASQVLRLQARAIPHDPIRISHFLLAERETIGKHRESTTSHSWFPTVRIQRDQAHDASRQHLVR